MRVAQQGRCSCSRPYSNRIIAKRSGSFRIFCSVPPWPEVRYDSCSRCHRYPYSTLREGALSHRPPTEGHGTGTVRRLQRNRSRLNPRDPETETETGRSRARGYELRNPRPRLEPTSLKKCPCLFQVRTNLNILSHCAHPRSTFLVANTSKLQ